MTFRSMRQPKLGFGNLLVIDLLADGGMMVGDVVTCLGMDMHGGGEKRGRGDQQNVFHLTLRLKSGRHGRKTRSNGVG